MFRLTVDVSIPDSRVSVFMCTISICVLIIACSTSNRGLFASKSPHEKYSDRISQAGLTETALGRNWIAAATSGLTKPMEIKLPYKESGYFDASKPAAEGFRFTCRRGEQLIVELNIRPSSAFHLFMDLWQTATNPNGQPTFIASADTNTQSITHEIKKEGAYLLRIQPELLAGGEYSLTIRTGPSLAFPAATSAKSAIASFWGADRDGGARRHEGIDIFGPRRTPLLASADGTIQSVTENNLGGKVIFLRPKNKDYVLYYAHLEEQLVTQGQAVKTGDTIGLMGNTGNARSTAPHLHFGIYASGGAIDPLPFVDRNLPSVPAIKAPMVQGAVRSKRKTSLYMSPDERSQKVASPDQYTFMQVQATAADWYKVSLPNGVKGYVAAAATDPAREAFRSFILKSDQALLDQPDSTAATKDMLQKGDQVQVMGNFNNYYYVLRGDKTGWLVYK